MMRFTLVILFLLIAISYSIFVYVPSNLKYKVFLSPPATLIEKINLSNQILKLSTDSTVIKIKYNGIESLIKFLNNKFPVNNKKILVKIEASKPVHFMNNVFTSKQFLTNSGWYYCIYENIIYIFQVKTSQKIIIPIPKFKVRILSIPKSKLYISQKYIGTTPFSTTLYMGNYQILFKPIETGYKTLTKNIQINEDKILDVQLERLNKVIINTNLDPKDTTILINGKKTRKEIYLENGKYLLTINATGFYSINRTIDIQKKENNLYFELKPKIFSIRIQSLKKAQIYIDGIMVGVEESTISIPAGKHKISVYLKGYTPYEKEVNLQENLFIDAKLSPLPGTIVLSYNIKNAMFARYSDGKLTIMTKENIFNISKSSTIDIIKNDNYSFMYDNILIDRAGKLKIGNRIFTVKPFITSIIKYKTFYIISTSSGDLYTFNGRTPATIMKGLSLNYAYIKIILSGKEIIALSSNGSIYKINIQNGSLTKLISEKFIKDFNTYDGKIYAVSNNKIYVYQEKRKLKYMNGRYEHVYKNFAYGNYCFNIEKEDVVGKCSLKAENCEIYYYNNYIYDPKNNEKYHINGIPIKMEKYNEYLVIIEKDKVEVMKL